VRFLPAFGSALGVVVLAGGLALHPELVRDPAPPPQPASSPVATTATDPAARSTVVAGMDPVTGVNSSTLVVDRALLGLPVIPNTPMVSLPEVVVQPPAPGKGPSITTQPQTRQVGSTAAWEAQPELPGPVRRVAQRTTAGYITVPSEAGELHLLCGPGSASYYVDSHLGGWRIIRTDGAENYDVSYQFVQYDRSPISAQSRCR
jgi:hypothetical protein